MKKLLSVLALCVLVLPICVLAEEVAAATPAAPSVSDKKEFVVYTDKGHKDNHYIPSGWMGDVGDIKMNDQFMDNPHSGTTCIQFVYTAKKAQGLGWTGVYWQNPANNWGSKKGGFDLTGMTKLTFWARGAKGGEVITKFNIGGIQGTYPDTVNVEIGPIELTDTWKEYTINLAGKDLSYINGAFGWGANADSNPEGLTFYMDDIKFEIDPNMKPQAKQPEKMPFYVYADRGAMANHFIPSGYMGDYSDIKYNGAVTENPYLGTTCIKITYTAQGTQGARWAGMYWQNPANNWANIDKGYNLFSAKKLTFWARGEKGGERIEEFKIGGIMGEFSDSDTAAIGPVILNKEWTQYTIDLDGKDMSYIVGGFCWSTNIDVNPDGAVFYLDEIKYE